MQILQFKLAQREIKARHNLHLEASLYAHHIHGQSDAVNLTRGYSAVQGVVSKNNVNVFNVT